MTLGAKYKFFLKVSLFKEKAKKKKKARYLQ